MKEELEVLQDGNALLVESGSIPQLAHEAHEQLVIAIDAHVGGTEFFTQRVNCAELTGGGIRRGAFAGWRHIFCLYQATPEYLRKI